MADGEKIPLRRRLLPWRAARYPGPTRSEIGLADASPVRADRAVAPTPPDRPVARPGASDEPPWPVVAARSAPPPLLDVNALLARRFGLSGASTSRSGGHRPAPASAAPSAPSNLGGPRLLDHLILPGTSATPAVPDGPVPASAPRP